VKLKHRHERIDMSPSLFDLHDRVAVVTGGTGVLGAAMARGLARCGMHVAVLGRNEERGQRIVAQIEADGGAAQFVAMDVTSAAQCRQAADAVLSRWGTVDALVNAAGGNHPDATATPERSFFDLDSEALQFVMQLNALGTILPCQAFGRHFAQQQTGAIVNISSMAALRPLTRVVGYSAAKAAVNNFTQWLSVYMCQTVGTRVRVNAIAPGFFLTDQNRYLLTEPESGELTARGRQIIDHTPMGRFGEPDELLGTLQWLLSDAAAFVTGIVVPVDGGFSAFAGV
jgi:NAD(P)-dependent dehydrogenase (short-subunit alcohol dehydrogenase family)